MRLLSREDRRCQTENGHRSSARPARAGRRRAALRPPSGPSGQARSAPARSGRAAARSMPKRRSVSMWTKMSGVPSPRVRKPKPRRRLNHFTMRPLEPAGRRHRDMGARRRHLRRMDRGRTRPSTGCGSLQALRPLQHLADDARAFIGGLEAVAAQAGHVQQDVRQAVVGDDEAIALGDIEPLDDAGRAR